MEDEILRLARDRAAALAASDATELTALLHERFVWTSHRGDRFAREEYVVRNVGGAVRWRSQDDAWPHSASGRSPSSGAE